MKMDGSLGTCLASFELAGASPTLRTPYLVGLWLRGRRYVVFFPLLSLFLQLLFVLGGLFLARRRLRTKESPASRDVSALFTTGFPCFELLFGLRTLPTVVFTVTDLADLRSVPHYLSFLPQFLIRASASATFLDLKDCAALVSRTRERFTALRTLFRLLLTLFGVVFLLSKVLKRISARTFKVTVDAELKVSVRFLLPTHQFLSAAWLVAIPYRVVCLLVHNYLSTIRQRLGRTPCTSLASLECPRQ